MLCVFGSSPGLGCRLRRCCGRFRASPGRPLAPADQRGGGVRGARGGGRRTVRPRESTHARVTPFTPFTPSPFLHIIRSHGSSRALPSLPSPPSPLHSPSFPSFPSFPSLLFPSSFLPLSFLFLFSFFSLSFGFKVPRGRDRKSREGKEGAVQKGRKGLADAFGDDEKKSRATDDDDSKEDFLFHNLHVVLFSFRRFAVLHAQEFCIDGIKHFFRRS